MDDYAIFGFSAGGLMTTAYSFANYEDCCHKNHLPRPKVIFPMYGLDWDIKALPEDKGLAVFSIVGRDDEFGFANVEDKLPELEKVLGKENVSVRIVDGLGHGFGIGNETKSEKLASGSSHLLGSPQIGTDKNLFKEDFIMSSNLKELIRQMTLEEKKQDYVRERISGTRWESKG